MRNEKISFSKLKLTNNKQLVSSNSQNSVRFQSNFDEDSNKEMFRFQSTLILNSMHKYMPRLTIVEVSSCSSDSTLSPKSNSPPREMFTFAETQFIAVTAYQNTDVSVFDLSFA